MDKRWNLIHYNKVRQRSGTDNLVLYISSLINIRVIWRGTRNHKQNSVLQAPRLWYSVMCCKKLESDRRMKWQKWSPLALKALCPAFPEKRESKFFFCLCPAQNLQKGWKKDLVFCCNEQRCCNCVCLKLTVSFLADLRSWHLSFPEVRFSPAQPGADASRKGSGAHSKAGILLSLNTSAHKQLP